MIEHVPGSVEAGPLPSASLVGLLEQIRRDIESQTVELKRCITFAIPQSPKAAEDLPARAWTADSNTSKRSGTSNLGVLGASGLDGGPKIADEVVRPASRGSEKGATGLSMAAASPFPSLTNAHWAPGKGRVSPYDVGAKHADEAVRPTSRDGGELFPPGSILAGNHPAGNHVSQPNEVRNSLLRSAGVSPPKQVGFDRGRSNSANSEDGDGVDSDGAFGSEEPDINRSAPDITRAKRSRSRLGAGRSARDDLRGSDQSMNTLAQKAWSHFSAPNKTNKKKKGMKTALREKSHVEQNVFFRVTNHSWYELASTVLILLNALTIALETDHRCRRAMTFDPATILRDEIHWVVLRDIFCWLFFAELSLRIAAQKWEFLTSADWEWNLFDCVVVLSAFVETFMSHARGNMSNGESATSGFDEIIAHSSLLRILRLLRIVRVLRVVSMSRTMGKLLCFQDLRTMVSALCGALKSLLWVVVTMLLIILIFAIYFTEGAIDRFILSASDPALDTETLRAKYGGLPTAMLSLLKAITGGEDWGDTLEPLEVLPVLYPFVFIVYILFGVLALMNIVTAVFVDSTVQRSRNDQNYIIQAENWSKKEFIQTMCFIFEELDSDCSGQISLDELKKFIESSTIATYFSALDLNITEVRTLFSLIDVDHSGTIDRDEFIWGCLRLKGDAKSLDLALLQYDVKAIQQSLQEISDVIAPEDPAELDGSQRGVSDGLDAEIMAMAARDDILAAA